DQDKAARGVTTSMNEDAVTQRSLEKAGYASDPATDGTLDGYQIYPVPMTSITVRAVESLGVGKKEAERAKNMFALGLVSWMYGRPVDVTLHWLEQKFGGKQEIYESNLAAFNAGYNFGETTELFAHQVHVGADRPGGEHGAADDRRRRDARRAVDRHADEERAGRPPSGDVRSPWRVPDPDRRVLVARGLLRGRDGGRTRRDPLSHAGLHP